MSQSAGAEDKVEKAVHPATLHYAERVEHFRKENAEIKKENPRLKNVVFLGDSLTEGFDLQKAFPGKRVINRGISSDIIGIGDDPLKRGVLNRLDVSVNDCNTTHVFVLIGVNDLGDGKKPQELFPGYREIVTRIREKVPSVTIHLQSALPTRGRFAFHNPDILELNRGIKKIAAELGCDYVELHSLYADDKGELREEFTGDGLHLKPEAYEPWKRKIDRVMGW